MLKFLNFFVSKALVFSINYRLEIATTIAYSNNLSAILLVIVYKMRIFFKDLTELNILFHNIFF